MLDAAFLWTTARPSSYDERQLMGIFGKLFGGKQREKAGAATQAASAQVPKRATPELIDCFDESGRKLQIPAETWRTRVLGPNLKKHWDAPDALYGLIVSALQDGFGADVVAATEHFFAIEPNRERATTLWGIVLMEEGHLAQAEKVLRDYLRDYGDSAVVLVNLAKVESRQGHEDRAQTHLWRSLELDPNGENALAWFQALAFEAGGEEARHAALERVAALSGSIRAQLWLARGRLEQFDLPGALALYRQALARVVGVPPADVLMQISGDLGQAGKPKESIELVEPVFDLEQHGIVVANNLLKSHLELGHLDEAEKLLARLAAWGRPSDKEALSYWKAELAKERLARDNPN